MVRVLKNEILGISTFKGQMSLVSRMLQQGYWSAILNKLQRNALGKATAPVVNALERLNPYIRDQNIQREIQKVLSPDFYRKANFHPKTAKEIEIFRKDRKLISRTSQVVERLKGEIGISNALAIAFRMAMLKYPRAAFLAHFYDSDQVYSNIPLAITDRELIGGYDYQASVLAILGLERGQRVLHIGTGTAWPDALISELIGHQGELVSLDVRNYLIEDARRRFKLFGLSNTQHLNQNGLKYFEGFAVFDRILWSAVLPSNLLPLITDRGILQLKIGGIFQHPISREGVQLIYEQIILNSENKIERKKIKVFELDLGIEDHADI